jgi:hypothetical protein
MSENDTRPAPPGHLSKDARKLFDSIVESYGFTSDETDALATLTLALEAWDGAGIARRRLKRDGRYVEDRFGQLKTHPAVVDHRDCLATWTRLLGQLGIPDPGDEEQGKDRRGRFAPKGGARATR